MRRRGVGANPMPFGPFADCPPAWGIAAARGLSAWRSGPLKAMKTRGRPASGPAADQGVRPTFEVFRPCPTKNENNLQKFCKKTIHNENVFCYAGFALVHSNRAGNIWKQPHKAF